MFQIVGDKVRILDHQGVAATFGLPNRPGDPYTFTRDGRTYAYTQPSGLPAGDAPFRRGVHAGQRTWGAFLRAVLSRDRRNGRLSYLLVGTTLQVVLHTQITRTRCRFEVAQ